MTTVDWVLLAVLLVSVLLGAWRGLVYEVLSLLSWVAAFVLARWFATDLGAQLPMGKVSETARYFAGFAAIFVLTLVICALLITLLKRFMSAVGLRPVDRALGALFGLLRGVLLLLAVVLVVGRTPLQRNADWHASTGVQSLGSLAKIVVPMLPSEIARYLPE